MTIEEAKNTMSEQSQHTNRTVTSSDDDLDDDDEEIEFQPVSEEYVLGQLDVITGGINRRRNTLLAMTKDQHLSGIDKQVGLNLVNLYKEGTLVL